MSIFYMFIYEELCSEKSTGLEIYKQKYIENLCSWTWTFIFFDMTLAFIVYYTWKMIYAHNKRF